MSNKAGQDSEEMAAVHHVFDTDQEEPEVDVASVIADLEGRDRTELSALYNTIDDLIQNLFADPPSAEAQAQIAFSYEGYRVILNQDGHATLMKIPGGMSE